MSLTVLVGQLQSPGGSLNPGRRGRPCTLRPGRAQAASAEHAVVAQVRFTPSNGRHSAGVREQQFKEADASSTETDAKGCVGGIPRFRAVLMATYRAASCARRTSTVHRRLAPRCLRRPRATPRCRAIASADEEDDRGTPPFREAAMPSRDSRKAASCCRATRHHAGDGWAKRWLSWAPAAISRSGSPRPPSAASPRRANEARVLRMTLQRVGGRLGRNRALGHQRRDRVRRTVPHRHAVHPPSARLAATWWTHAAQADKSDLHVMSPLRVSGGAGRFRIGRGDVQRLESILPVAGRGGPWNDVSAAAP